MKESCTVLMAVTPPLIAPVLIQSVQPPPPAFMNLRVTRVASATVEHAANLLRQRHAVKVYFPRNIYLNPGYRVSPYFSELFTSLKWPLTVLPMPLTAATMTMLMPTAISAYSIAVAPDSSRKKSDMSFEMRRTANSGH